jgi:hypothetical protein
MEEEMTKGIMLKNALIAYNCHSKDVKVGHLIQSGQPDWAWPYQMTTGAAFFDVRRMKGLRARHYVMSTFISLVVRDGVDLKSAYEAFWQIKEFREAIPEDMQYRMETNIFEET